jgi:hypothetical protein
MMSSGGSDPATAAEAAFEFESENRRGRAGGIANGMDDGNADAAEIEAIACNMA